VHHHHLRFDRYLVVDHHHWMVAVVVVVRGGMVLYRDVSCGGDVLRGDTLSLFFLPLSFALQRVHRTHSPFLLNELTF